VNERERVLEEQTMEKTRERRVGKECHQQRGHGWRKEQTREGRPKDQATQKINKLKKTEEYLEGIFSVAFADVESRCSFLVSSFYSISEEIHCKSLWLAVPSCLILPLLPLSTLRGSFFFSSGL
jgi:hypothetical protein